MEKTAGFFSPVLGRTIAILYEDKSLIAVDKPSGVLSQGDYSGQPTLIDAIKYYLKTAYNKPGNVFLGVIQRLDRPVSGVIVYAKTTKAASRLSEQIRNRTFQKTYRAVLEGIPHYGNTLKDRIGKGADRRMTTVSHGGKPSELTFHVIDSGSSLSRVQISLITGRKHQIRVQFASRGNPICGDRTYGANSHTPDPRGNDTMALFAHQIICRHPISGDELVITAPDPPFWTHAAAQSQNKPKTQTNN